MADRNYPVRHNKTQAVVVLADVVLVDNGDGTHSITDATRVAKAGDTMTGGLVVSAGGVTDNTLTRGRVTFADTSGRLLDDAALLWNNTTKFLSVGTTYKFVVLGDQPVNGDLPANHALMGSTLGSLAFFAATTTGGSAYKVICGYYNGSAIKSAWEINNTTGGTAGHLKLMTGGGYTSVGGDLVVPKTTGMGIRVDPASPTFGWRDMLGEIVARGTGAGNPTWTAFRGGVYAYQFSGGAVNEVWTQFHIPHDWLPGTVLYVHVHWGQNTVDTGGPAGVPGSAKWYFELSYADGYGTAGGAGDPFIAPLTVSVVQQASTTQYAHMIAEVQCGVAGGAGGTMLNTSTIQVDGLILCHLYRDKTDAADTLDQGPFIFMCDMHYQTNGVLGTKDKNPPFYT